MTLPLGAIARAANYMVGPAYLVSSERALAEGAAQSFLGRIGVGAGITSGVMAASTAFESNQDPNYISKLGAIGTALSAVPDLGSALAGRALPSAHRAMLAVRSSATLGSAYFGWYAAHEAINGNDEAANWFGRISSWLALAGTVFGLAAEYTKKPKPPDTSGPLTPEEGPQRNP